MKIRGKWNHLNRMQPYDNQSKFVLIFCVIYYYVVNRLKRLWPKPDVVYPSGLNTFSLEEINQKLEEIVFENLGNHTPDLQTNKRHLITKIHSKKAHILIGQKTLALAMVARFKETNNKKYLDLLKDVLDYCLIYQEKEGLFRYHNPLGLPQDEGPVTAGLIQALCQGYKLTGNPNYLSSAQKAANGSVDVLYHQKYGFLHTRFHEIETTNVNSSFALAFFNLYEITKENNWLDWGYRCLNYVIRMQEPNGLFVYTNIRKSIYKASYHFLVVMTLMTIDSKFEINSQIKRTIKLAQNHADSLIEDDGCVTENDMYIDSWAPSNARACSYLSMTMNVSKMSILIKNLSRHITSDGNFYFDRKNSSLSNNSRKGLTIMSIVDMYYDLSIASLNR